MESITTTHINLIDDDEKDPLELDMSSGRNSTEDAKCSVSTNLKHSHGLRRHVPRIIVKPILPDKKGLSTISSLTSSINAAIVTTAVNTLNVSSTVNTSSICSPTSRGNSSRRLQQQQRTKAAITVTAAAAIANMTVDSTVSAQVTTAITQASTMREVLASIPGFSIKPRRRSSKKISTAAQIEQTKDGKIDLETPDSILASTNLRALLNKQTFSMLPPLYQYNLIQLLPSVDRETVEMEHKCLPNTIPSETIRLGPSSLNNEFFARACLEWRERLAEGEFTPENQIKLKTEAEREKNKLDPWKLKHFEPIWGEKTTSQTSSCSNNDRAALKTLSTKNIAVSNSIVTNTISSVVQTKTPTTSLTNSTTTKTISASTPCLHITNSAFTNNTTESYSATFFNFTNIADTQSTSTATINDRSNFTINYIKNGTSLNNVPNNSIVQQKPAKLIVVPQTAVSSESVSKSDITNSTCTQNVDILKEITQNKEHQSSSFVVLTTISPSKTSDVLKRGTKRTSACENSQQVIPDSVQGKHFKVEFKSSPLQTIKESLADRSERKDLYTTNNVVCPLLTSDKERAHNIDASDGSMSEEGEHEHNNNHFIVPFETLTENETVEKDGEARTPVNCIEENILSSNTNSTCHIPQSEFNSLECKSTTMSSIERMSPHQNHNNNDYHHKQQIVMDPSIHLTNCNTNNMQSKENGDCSSNKNESNDGSYDDKDLVEQKFADAQNYVMESREISSDENSGTKFKDNINNNTINVTCQPKPVNNDVENTFNNSLEIASSMSSPPSLPSTISCSATGSSSISLAEMKAMISSVACLTSAQTEPSDRHPENIVATESTQRNEIFHHIQHDWNFGDIKIQQQLDQPPSTTNNFNNLLQSQGVVIKLNSLRVDSDDKNSDSAIEVNCSSDLDEHGRENTVQQVAEDLLDDGDLVMNIEEDDRCLSDSNTVKMLVADLQHQRLIHLQQQQHVTEAIVQTLAQPMNSAQYIHKSNPSLPQSQGISLQEPEQQPLCDYNEEFSSEIMCEVPMTGAEMEVSSTVLANSNSNDSSNGLKSLCGSNSNLGTLSGNMKAVNTVFARLHQQQQHNSPQIINETSNQDLQNTPDQSQQHQRQILVDSNGQIIGNFLIQQQHQQDRHMHNQEQLSHQSTPQFTFQPSQHSHQIADRQQQQPPPNKLLSTMPRKTYEVNANVQQHFLGATETVQTPAAPMTVSPIQSLSHTEITQNPFHQYSSHSLPQSQSSHIARHFFINHSASPTNNSTAASQNLLASCHDQQHQQLQLQQQLLQQQQQQLTAFSTLNAQTQQHQEHNSSFTGTSKFVSKQMDIISFPTRSAISLKSGAIPSTIPAIATQQQQSLSTTFNNNNNNIINVSIFNNNSNYTSSSSTVTPSLIKTLPTLGISPTSISQQKPVTVKVPSNKGRKTTSKLPPGAVNLERSYQICQAVIQNSPNRENLKAQLRPPSALLNQQQQQQNNIQSVASLTNSIAINTVATAANTNMLKNSEDVVLNAIATGNVNNLSPASIPVNIMGVSRPNVYKVIGPRMGFPRKKYVQRKSSPGLIRHIFANQSTATLLQTTKAPPPNVTNPQLTILQQTTTPISQATAHHNLLHGRSHDIHHNGNSQYVLIHRANVGAADNHAPRASSAPPVPLNQNSLHGLNGMSITGRGRPASVDVDICNRSIKDVQNSLHINNPNIHLMRRNLSTTTGNVYIEGLNGSSSNIVDNSSNYIVTKATTTTLSNIRAMRPHNQKQSISGISATNSQENNCACSLNAMVICQQCGAYCHDDCVNSLKLCGACVIR